MSGAEQLTRLALRESMLMNGDKTTKGKYAMNSQSVINSLAAVALACGGWWCNNIWSAVQNQQQQITVLNVELAKNYAPRGELQQRFDRIDAKLDAIDTQIKRNRQ